MPSAKRVGHPHEVVMTSKLSALVLGLGMSLVASSAQAGITVSPYVSIRSTKSIKPGAKSSGTETETIKQRQEAGVRGGITFWRLFGLHLGVGQSTLTTTEKVQEAVDEYGEIDYEKDLNMSTENPENEIKITEVQRNAKLTVSIDPGFWIFILRAKAGVTAQQRILTTEVTGEEPRTDEFGPTYKPHSGFGFGVRFTPQFYAIAEYNMNHYKFPEIEPFEREVSVSFAVNL
jgi:hypothetical protein